MTAPADEGLPYNSERIIDRLAAENARLHDVIRTLLDAKDEPAAEAS